MSNLLTHEEYSAIANSLSFPTNAFINGQFQSSKSGKTFKTINPATGNVIATNVYVGASEGVVISNALRKLRVEGLVFKDINTELYEAQIPPLLRLFHIQEISPSGWIALLSGSYTEHKEKSTTCDYEFSIH